MDIGRGVRLNFIIKPEGVDSPCAEFNAGLLRAGTVWRVTIPCKVAIPLGLDAGSMVHVKVSKTPIEESRRAEFSALAMRMNGAWWVKIPAKTAKAMDLKPKERLSVKVAVEGAVASSVEESEQERTFTPTFYDTYLWNLADKGLSSCSLIRVGNWVFNYEDTSPIK